MIFKDAFKLRLNKEVPGAIALGWLGVILVLGVSMGYTNLISHNAISYLMWFISGYIISKACIFNTLTK